ncbi:hypothetical protein ACTXT7_010649 [Hymenolepis weldensis]
MAEGKATVRRLREGNLPTNIFSSFRWRTSNLEQFTYPTAINEKSGCTANFFSTGILRTTSRVSDVKRLNLTTWLRRYIQNATSYIYNSDRNN